MQSAPLIKHRYVLDIGQSQDWLALQVAIAPCLLGYGAIAKKIHADPKSKREGNIYWKWIENYVADDYAEAVRAGSGELHSGFTHHHLLTLSRISGTTCSFAVSKSHRRTGANICSCDQGKCFPPYGVTS